MSAAEERPGAGPLGQGVIAWFGHNSVAANLMMALILVGGAMTIYTIKQEVFPEFSLDMITITVPYLGAAPEEVKEGVCVRIEEEIQDLDGVGRWVGRVLADDRKQVGRFIVGILDPIVVAGFPAARRR